MRSHMRLGHPWRLNLRAEVRPMSRRSPDAVVATAPICHVNEDLLGSHAHADTKSRSPRLQEVICRAPAEYVTVGWLTSTLHRHSFGIIMLSLGLLATAPVGSTIPGLILAIMAVQLIVGRAEPVFPRFIMTRRLKQSCSVTGITPDGDAAATEIFSSVFSPESRCRRRPS